MKKFILIALVLLSSITAFGKINVKIYKPIRFEETNSNGILGDTLVGEGEIQISTDDEEDFGKKLVFSFQKFGYINNRKKWLKINEFKIAESDKEYIVQEKNSIIKIFATIKRKDIKDSDLDLVDGLYVDYFPIIIAEYSKPMKIEKEKI